MLALGSGFDYRFQPIDGYLGSTMAGASLTMVGFFLLLGDPMAAESMEGGGASH